MEARAQHPGAGHLNEPTARVVGIDLGTTNSAVAWLDPADPVDRAPTLFAVPQLVAAGEVAARPTFPSFLYFPTPAEQETGMLALPWDPHPELVAGVFARDHGALLPSRQVSSAKSWLSNTLVDRRAPLLPWAAEGSPHVSPVEASTHLLRHLRLGWDHVHADAGLPLDQQQIVLTVPASFDDEARELTVEAARAAGLPQLLLLEEPLAAVYAWMASHLESWPSTLGEGQLLLVCDVGGGTTDFSLIRAVRGDRGEIAFERIAIGEHLLLGGDNVDLALAAMVERKLADQAHGIRLDLVQRQILRRRCTAAKEQLLSVDGPEHVPITLLGSGRSVVGGSMTTELTVQEVVAVLEMFLPAVRADARPQRETKRALRELGLPYENDPAVTRHLAAFLERAARNPEPLATGARAVLARPDAVLFNGGFFTPAAARARIVDALTDWFGTRPAVLENRSPEAAVALGAAFYGGLRARATRGAARLVIRAASARAYYVGVQDAEANGGTRAVCVMPRGTNEGTSFTLDREFTVIANQPAAFTLFSSTTRDDAVNDVVTLTDAGDVHRHAPLVTALRYGQRSRRVPLPVRLHMRFTEVGTLELWCESVTSEHRWRLQFNLRAIERGATAAQAVDEGEPRDQVIIGDEAVDAASRAVRAAFESADSSALSDLPADLERTLGYGRQAWPLAVIRKLADVLLEVAERRRASPRHEARWLNLTGFCMRPGFGTPLDPFRVTQLRNVYGTGLVHAKDVQCQVEWLILWQRVSAGFTPSQQQELASRIAAMLGLGVRKAPHLNPQMFRDAWRLLAGLERLDRGRRVRFGDELLRKLRREPQNASLLWSLGRLGARVPLYGPLNSVVTPDVAERWLESLRALRAVTPETFAAAVDLGARTDDPARDIHDAAREAAIQWLTDAGAPDDAIRRLREPLPIDPLMRGRAFGEPLPEGLRMEAPVTRPG